MSHLTLQRNIASVVMCSEGDLLLDNNSGRFSLSLLIETTLVVIIAVAAIMISDSRLVLGPTWLITPGILIITALVPTAIKRRKFAPFGFTIRHLKDSLTVLGWTCIAVLPLTFCGLWLLKSFGIDLLLRPGLPKEQGWIGWLLYQFMYIALAEEVFFRGYIQSNILKSTESIMGKQPRQHQWMSIGLSAGCFALVHVLVQGQIASALIFLPGLVLGWLFIRTKCLLAPILFHGIANTYYLLIAMVFA